MLIAVRLGAYCSAFWCNLRCVLVLIAVFLARNSTPFRSNSIFMQNWDDLYLFVHVAPFVQKQTFVRIDYMRPSGDLFANQPLIVLKYCLKS